MTFESNKIPTKRRATKVVPIKRDSPGGIAGDFLSDDFAVPIKMPWPTLVESFLMRLSVNLASKTWQDNVRTVLRRFTEYQGLWRKTVEQVTQLDLQQYVARRSKDSWSPPTAKKSKTLISVRTINNEIAILNSVFQYAGPRANCRGHRDNLAVVSQPLFFKPLKTQELNPIAVTSEKLASFIAAIPLAKSPRPSVCDPIHFWKAVLVLDSITALRRGALLGIPRPDHETLCIKRVIILPAELSKNSRAEIIPLGSRDDVIGLLASLPSKPGEPLLPWKSPGGRRLSLSRFNRVMKDFQLEAGILQPLKTKHLRSTAATEILAEQYSTDTARKRLGHKSEDVIRKHYQARTVTQADRDVSDHLATRVMNLFPSAGMPTGTSNPGIAAKESPTSPDELDEIFALFRTI